MLTMNGGMVAQRRRARRASGLGVLLVCSVLILPSAAGAQLRPPGVLRVCADPNSLPFSNRQEAGFENEIARLLAGTLGWKLEYLWWAQRRGFIRNTLAAGRCDVVMGVPVGAERVLTTQPYYSSSYVFVQRAGTAPVRSLDDLALRSLRVGVQLIGDDFANAPPAHSLGRRGIVDNVVGFMVYGDYASTDPERPIIDAVATGHIDLAIVWGPLAGYYATRAAAPLELRPVEPLEDGPVRLRFAIALGVRRKDTELRRLLDAALERKRHEIGAILSKYGLPSVGGRR